MGRWAEVYFTSPPEKREQAVLELLRELQEENAPAEGGERPSAAAVQDEASEPAFARSSPLLEVPETPVRCHACGVQNSGSHRFCGMCGAPLAELAAVSDRHAADLNIEDQIEDRQPEFSPRHEPAPPAPSNESQFVRSEEAVYEPALITNELSLFQTGREVDYRDGIYDPVPTSGSYRIYLGIALAVMIFALAYVAWRSERATSQSGHLESQAPPAVTTQPAAPAPAAPATSAENTPDRTPPANQPAAVPSRADRSDEETTAQTRDKATPAKPPRPAITAKNPPAEAAARNGADELAMAQRYLNGTDGERRNPAEAAKWLWKSMAKHNARATLLLADLYLKGDGVSKNCDQARVLLDSAARGGMKEAGEQLRHLQAFGCE